MAFPFLEDFFKYFFGVSIFLPIPTFGAVVGIAVLLSYWIFGKEIRRLEAEGKIEVKDKPLSSMMGDFSFITLIWAMVGARLFHILEYPAEFMEDPIGMIFSRGGFTVIGALLFGTIAGVRFIKRRGFAVLPATDAAGIAMILGYAVGRIGCQLSGDGDWGHLAKMSLKPDWLPTWLWAQQYIGNVVQAEIPLPGVYPTPIYETVAGLFIFAVLWMLRKHPFKPGWLFSLYLLLSGVERLLIEQIRVNSRFHLLGVEFTQAEALSAILIAMGIAGLIYFSKKPKPVNTFSAQH